MAQEEGSGAGTGDAVHAPGLLMVIADASISDEFAVSVTVSFSLTVNMVD